MISHRVQSCDEPRGSRSRNGTCPIDDTQHNLVYSILHDFGAPWTRTTAPAAIGSSSTSCPTYSRARTDQSTTALIRNSNRARPFTGIWAGLGRHQRVTPVACESWFLIQDRPRGILPIPTMPIIAYLRLFLRPGFEDTRIGVTLPMVLDCAIRVNITGSQARESDGIGPTATGKGFAEPT